VNRSRWALACSVVLLSSGPATAQEGAWSPPVDGPVVRGYEPPHQGLFGPRHLGIDYGVPPGTAVRAAGDGIVVFAGLTGGSESVAIEHPGARRTTYAYLRRIAVGVGAAVRQGDRLGWSGESGPGHRPDRLHFGYRVNGRPEDPASLFRPSSSRISLAPLDRPECPRLGAHPTAPGREYTRPDSIGVRR
jgi:murein DD-endopeptidase MepM/ murein hydrolase activator NlpD